MSTTAMFVLLGAITVLLLAASPLILHALEAHRVEQRRRQIATDQALAEARIHLHTTQATQAMFDAARDAMHPQEASVIRVEQQWNSRDPQDG